MIYVAPIKECPDKQNVYDLERNYIPFFRDLNVTSTLIDFSVNGRSQCILTSFLRPSTNIYICRHHLSEGLLTFTLLLNFFWFVITASVNLHSIVNGLECTNLKADLNNSQLLFGDGSNSDYFGWYFWHFCQYPKEVTDIWKQVQYPLLPHSLKLTNFNGISFVCVLLDM